MKMSEHIERMRKYPPDTEIVEIVWLDEDVEYQAESMNIELTKEEVGHVIDLLSSHHDANYGINWDTIGCEIDNVVGQREE